MLRTAVSKVAWVGRTASMVFGLALVLALMFGVASMALGATGGNFLLGKKNVADAISTLVKQGPGPALSLVVEANQPPLKVNSTTKVANLNADRLDGLDSTGLRASCSSGTQFLGGACIENTVRGTGNLSTSSSTCAGLGGRLPTAAELDAFRQFPNITIGNVGGLTIPNQEWTGDIEVNVSAGATTMSDLGEYSSADRRNTQAFRCVVSPS